MFFEYYNNKSQSVIFETVPNGNKKELQKGSCRVVLKYKNGDAIDEEIMNETEDIVEILKEHCGDYTNDFCSGLTDLILENDKNSNLCKDIDNYTGLNKISENIYVIPRCLKSVEGLIQNITGEAVAHGIKKYEKYQIVELLEGKQNKYLDELRFFLKGDQSGGVNTATSGV